MILGIIIGIIGIIFACKFEFNLVLSNKFNYYLAQIDGFMNADRINNPNLVEKNVNFKKENIFLFNNYFF
jgi:hypothetical protein